MTGRTFDENMKLSRSIGSPYEVCMIGLNFENRQDLYDRINLRVGIMADSGMVEEAEKVYRSGDIETAGQAIGFKELIPYFEGRDTKEHCLDNIRQVSRHYAKRQLTWFRRERDVDWINYPDFDYSKEKILDYIVDTLHKRNIVDSLDKRNIVEE